MLALGQCLRDRYRIDALPDLPPDLNAYRAYDIVENRLCAIKEFGGEAAIQREREAAALLSHRHPNLPLCYDAFTLDSSLYVVFEWPEGETLQARLERAGRLPEADATRWLNQILTALDYSHTLNLPIAPEGFSPACLWLAPDGRPRLYAGLTALTAAEPYTAPEGGSGPRAAIYAAGATLFNLLTGHAPEPASPRKYTPTLNAATAQVIQRALNHRPEARFASIRDMRKALGRAKANDRLTLALGEPRHTLPLASLLGLAIGVTLISIGLFYWRIYQPAGAAALSTPTATPGVATSIPSVPPVPSVPPIPSIPSVPSSSPTPSPSPQPPTPTPNLTPQPGATAVAQTDNMILAFVPEGDFRMGSLNDDPQAFGNEKPQHTVFAPSFWIDLTEITNAQYRQCVTAKACAEPINVDSLTQKGYYQAAEYDEYPVIWVSWRQAKAYCEWAGRRLPTEAEWEKAARGTDGRLYPWGNQPPDNTLLNFNFAAKGPTRVGSFPNGASPYGALDMAGNVVEWVDGFYYDSYFVVVSNTVTPTPAFLGGVRVLRSSSWHDLFENIRVASRRYSLTETGAYSDVGFRCASDAFP